MMTSDRPNTVPKYVYVPNTVQKLQVKNMVYEACLESIQPF